MNIIQKLEKEKLISPPKWLGHSIHYLVSGGSIAYGTNTDTSDWDCIGWCIPEKFSVFPHLAGEIPGFGNQKQRFEQYIQHGIKYNERVYDITCFGIIKYFTLVMQNNPNSLETLFFPQDCVLHITQTGQMVRENRHIFIHKGLWAKHKGYSFSQLHKMSSQDRTGKRLENYNLHGFDSKFASHTVRLLLQAEQLLSTGDMDVRLHSDHLKAIRNGEVQEKEIREWFTVKEKELEKLYHESKLPWGPRESEIKELLLKCLEHHYGSLDKCVERLDKYEIAVNKIKEVLENI